MKKSFVKKNLTGISLLGVTLAASAVNVVTYSGQTSNLPTAAAQLLTNGYQLTQVVAANTTTNVITFSLFDSPTNYTTNVVPSYSGTQIIVTNYAYIYTNTVQGGPTTITNTNSVTGGIMVLQATLTTNIFTNVMWSQQVTVPSITNTYPVLLTMAVPAGTTSTFTPPINMFGFQGLILTNSLPTNVTGGTGNLALTVSYLPLK